MSPVLTWTPSFPSAPTKASSALLGVSSLKKVFASNRPNLVSALPPDLALSPKTRKRRDKVSVVYGEVGEWACGGWLVFGVPLLLEAVAGLVVSSRRTLFFPETIPLHGRFCTLLFGLMVCMSVTGEAFGRCLALFSRKYIIMLLFFDVLLSTSPSCCHFHNVFIEHFYKLYISVVLRS